MYELVCDWFSSIGEYTCVVTFLFIEISRRRNNVEEHFTEELNISLAYENVWRHKPKGAAALH